MILGAGIVFLMLSVWFFVGAYRRRHWVRLEGTVVGTDESRVGKYRAEIETAQFGAFTSDYDERGTFRIGQIVKCVWDGRDPGSLTVEHRDQLLSAGVVVGVVAIAVLVAALLNT